MSESNAKKQAAEKTFRPDANYFFAGILSWLIPGAGHWMLGYRVRAVVIGVTLLGVFWAGESVLAKNRAVTWKVHPVFFCLQAGNGFSAFLADGLWGEPARDESVLGSISHDLPVHLNLGILLTSVSGLLNALVVLHVFDPRTWKQALADADPPDSKGADPTAGRGTASEGAEGKGTA